MVVVQGLFAGLSLIVVIGAQNAFVLRQGLRGEHVAWVVAVCAAYAAMVAERPHAVGMVPARAMEELDRGASTQFDPAVVAAFERVAVERGLAPARS